MPKKPIDYSNCCIYKIEHIENDSLVYVGNTTNFNNRKYCHKSRSSRVGNKECDYKLYQMIRNHGGWDMFRMIEVEKYPCKDKREAEKRECELMKQFKANMNTKISYLTDEKRKSNQKEYTLNHTEEKKERDKEYYMNNQESKKEYREKNKERIKAYRESNKEKQRAYNKDYRERNKDIIKQYEKKYRENNREKMKEYNKKYRKRIKEFNIEDKPLSL
jgi:hypothetical protein